MVKDDVFSLSAAKDVVATEETLSAERCHPKLNIPGTANHTTTTPTVRLIRQHRAPRSPPPSPTPPVPEPPLLLPLRSPFLSPLRLSHSFPSLRISPARKEYTFRSVPCFIPHPVSVRVPSAAQLTGGYLRSLAVGLDLGRLGQFAGTDSHLCWEPIDALFGCSSAGHFVEHLGCVALSDVYLLLCPCLLEHFADPVVLHKLCVFMCCLDFREFSG